MAVLDAAGPQERAAVLLGAQLQGARSPFDGTAAAAATAAAGLLAPKRKRSQQLSMARCDTMAVLATQGERAGLPCDGCVPAGAAPMSRDRTAAEMPLQAHMHAGR